MKINKSGIAQQQAGNWYSVLEGSGCEQIVKPLKWCQLLAARLTGSESGKTRNHSVIEEIISYVKGLMFKVKDKCKESNL